MRTCLAFTCLILAGCSSPAPAPPPKSAAPEVKPPLKPTDERRKFPLANQVSMELVEQNLLGKKFLPGGNLAIYERKGKRYRQFLLRTASGEAAALLLFELKAQLRDAKFLAHFGGYFGLDGAVPVFVFPKGPYLAGVLDLPEKEADPIARDFAARLN